MGEEMIDIDTGLLTDAKTATTKTYEELEVNQVAQELGSLFTIIKCKTHYIVLMTGAGYRQNSIYIMPEKRLIGKGIKWVVVPYEPKLSLVPA